MSKEMLINVSEGEECRIALVEDGKLEELYMERTSSTSHVRNIYKGRVTNVEPSIQAAFVDFGLGRNGFLHISDLMPTYFGRRGEGIEERVGQKMARRDRPPIQRCLRRGDEIVVQIIKEGIGTKGPTLSTYLSIPGRMLVMMPGMESKGVSRKIEDDTERRRLKQILDSLQPPRGVGFILRTESIGKTKAEIERDFKYLTRLWENIDRKINSGPGPMELYTEGDLVTRTVRDLFSNDIDRIIVDNKDVAAQIKDVIKLSNPRTRNRVELFDEPVPMFHKFGIEREIELMYSRHVPLPSGGSLVIDSTEAIVAIDVNSGKNREHADAETTAFRVDMEAADEIPRQLRLRDLGGVIICDFIDLRFERHRRELEQRLHDNFKKDRAKTKVLRMSQFGIIEMTRQRMRPSLKRSIYFDCPHCKGAGLVKTPESMGLDVMRRLAIALNDLKVVRAELAVCPDVAFYLNNKKRAQLTALETSCKKRVVIRSDTTLGLDEMRLDLFDNRDGVIVLPELGDVLTAQPHTSQLGVRPPGQHGRNDRGGRRDNRQRQGGRPGQQAGRGRDARRDIGRGGRDDEEEQAILEDRYEAEQLDDAAPPGRELEAPDRAEIEADREAPERDDNRGREQEHDQEEEPTRDPQRERDQQPVRRPTAREQFHGRSGNGESRNGAAPQDRSTDDRRDFARQDREPAAGEEGGGRKRRRRRGRRGRGRGRRPEEAGQQNQNDNDRQLQDRLEEAEFAREGRDEGDRRPSDAFESDQDRDEDRDPLEETEHAEMRDHDERDRFPIGEEVDIEETVEVSDELPWESAAARREAHPETASEEPASELDEEEPQPKPAARSKSRAKAPARGKRGRTKAAAEPASDESAADPEEQSKPKSRRRTAATSRKRKSAAADTVESAASEAPRIAEPEAPLPVPVSKASTDRHLIEDEPAIHHEPLLEPPPRPRSYRDLDSIPDDYD